MNRWSMMVAVICVAVVASVAGQTPQKKFMLVSAGAK